MADALGMYLGYQGANLRNQAMSDEITQRREIAPLQIDALKLNIKGEELQQQLIQQNMKRQAQIGQLLASQQQQGPLSPGEDTTAPLYRQAAELQRMGNSVISQEPKLGNDLLTQSKGFLQAANETKRVQLAQHKQEIEQLANWANTVTDQASLDSVRQEVEAVHPGQWDQMQIPTVYNATTAKVFQRIAVSAMDAGRQAEAQIKIIESRTAAEYFATKLEKEHQDLINARLTTEQQRQQLAAPKEKETAYDKYLTEVAKEEALSATNLSTGRKEILKNLKKYPAKVKEPTWTDRATAWLFNEPVGEAESKQATALTSVQTEEEKAHQARLAAIETKYAAKGVVTPKRTTTNAQKPAMGLPAGSKKIGKTPEGADVYQSPDGRKWTL